MIIFSKDALIEEFLAIDIGLYISSVYSMFSDGIRLPLLNIPSLEVLMKSIGAEFLRPDALPGINHMRWIQYQSPKYNILAGTQLIQLYIFVCTIPTQNSTLIYALNIPLGAFFNVVKAVMLFYSYINYIYIFNIEVYVPVWM